MLDFYPKKGGVPVMVQDAGNVLRKFCKYLIPYVPKKSGEVRCQA